MKLKESKHSLLYASDCYVSDATLPKIHKVKDPDDYVNLLTHDQIQIGLCEIRGHRTEQEDAIAIDTSALIQSFKTLSQHQQHHVYECALNEIQNQYGQYQTTGSTACIATAWRDDRAFYLSTANLGDSAAYFILLDDNQTISIATQINALHNPSPELPEFDRLRKLGIKPYEDGLWRLPSGLAVSRALGDIDSERCGLIHIPEMTYHVYPYEKKSLAFIVVACDGLTEQDILNAKKIGHIVQHHYSESPDKIALALVNAAYDQGSVNGSADNISVIVFPVIEHVISAAVFDGHGGNQVSETASGHLYSIMHQHLNQPLT